jgi:hypothetical protein
MLTELCRIIHKFPGTGLTCNLFGALQYAKTGPPSRNSHDNEKFLFFPGMYLLRAWCKHCNDLKERSMYKICAELPDITSQYHVNDHNHFFDFTMLPKLLTPSCQAIICIFGTWGWITTFTIAHHLTLSCAWSIKSMLSQPISLNLF